MAFFNKAGSIIRQAACSKHVNREILASSPLVFQAIRCMSSKVFVGGLSYSIDEPTLRDTFSKYGEVNEAKIIYDRETGNSRGFGFVSYNTSEEATSAIQALDGKDFNGRVVRVNLATERARNPGYGGGGYGAGGGGYGGGYGGGGGGYGGGGYGGNSGYGGGGYGGGNSGGGYGGGNSGAGGGYGGGNSGAGGGYGGGNSGGGYGGGSTGGGYGGANNYGSGYGNEGSTDGVYDSGSNVGYENTSQNLGVTGTEYVSGGAVGETGSGESSPIANAAAGYNPGVPGDFKDDEDEPQDYADKRA